LAQRWSGYARIRGERYFTPAWVTEHFFSVTRFRHRAIIDPAAGRGDMLDVIKRMGHVAIGIDVRPGRADIVRADFLALSEPVKADIITNPPYGASGRLAVAFIEQALELTRRHRGQVVMLLRDDFDHGSTRRHIFADHPAFVGKYVLRERIRWVNLKQKKKGPSQNHCIFHWDWRRRQKGPPFVLGYL
jgi:predicted RNA methylase